MEVVALKKFVLVLCFAFAASILAAGVALAADPHAPVFDDFKPFTPGDLDPLDGSVVSGDVTPLTQNQVEGVEGAKEGKIYSVITAFGVSGTPGSGDAYFRFRISGDYRGVPHGRLKGSRKFALLTKSDDGFYMAADSSKIAVKKGGDYDLGEDLVMAEVALIEVLDAHGGGSSGGCALGFAPAGLLLLAPLFFLKR